MKKAEDSNGFMGSAWSGFKNLTGIGDSSDKVREKQEVEQKLLIQFNSNPQKRAEIFKKLTGQDYNPKNLLKFIKGEIKLPSELALSGYKEGQEIASDVTADVVSGVAAFGIYTAAVAAAPFTGGASIAVGVVAAAATGAAVKTGIKYADAKSGGRDYTLKDAGHDAATGAFSGVLAPATVGIGGAVGKTITVQAGKAGLKTTAAKAVGFTAEMATDGALGGGVDNAFRTAIDGGSAEEVLDAGLTGAATGAVAGPLLGWGGKSVAKGYKLTFTKANTASKTIQVDRSNTILDLISGKVDYDYAAATLRDIDELNFAFKMAESKGIDKAKLNAAKQKLTEQINANTADHGSIVMQSYINPDRFQVDTHTGVRYIKATKDDIFLAHIFDPEQEPINLLNNITKAVKETPDDAYLSLSLVNKHSAFFDEFVNPDNPRLYGIIAKNRSVNVTMAGNCGYTNYSKNFSNFSNHSNMRFRGGDEGNIMLKNSFLSNLEKNGIKISDEEYIQLFNKLRNMQYFEQITEDITIGSKVIKTEVLRDAVEKSNIDLAASTMCGWGGNNEVATIIDGVEAVFARVDDISQVPTNIRTFAKENDLKIVLLGSPLDLSFNNNSSYITELELLKSQMGSDFKSIMNFKSAKDELTQKYKNEVRENFKASTTLQRNAD